MAEVFLALGSNLNHPLEQLRQAIGTLNELSPISLTAQSNFYGSLPYGPQDQDDFVNAVIAIETSLSPLALLDTTQQIEQQQGRVRQRHWGERTLDIDILFYDKQLHQCERLTIPHPEILNRSFVIRPLLDIAPTFILPNGKTVEAQWQQMASMHHEIWLLS